MIALLFAASAVVIAPEGGLDAAPFSVVADVAERGVSDGASRFTQIALAN